MIVFGKHIWRGETGTGYNFNVTLTDRGIPDGGGIYVFVRRRFVFFLQPLYIGKATTFKSRLKKHERWADAWWLKGATERHLLREKNGKKRSRIEEDLIRRYHPPMNNEHVPRSKDDAPNDRKLRKTWRNWPLRIWRRLTT